jgi:hypothetical protein
VTSLFLFFFFWFFFFCFFVFFAASFYQALSYVWELFMACQAQQCEWVDKDCQRSRGGRMHFQVIPGMIPSDRLDTYKKSWRMFNINN